MTLPLTLLCLALAAAPAAGEGLPDFSGADGPPSVAGGPVTAAESAVVDILARMRHTLADDPGTPAPRGPHAWDAQRVLAAGTVNGCVESAKAFFHLLKTAHPELDAAYVDSFNSSCANAGHAVVAVTGSSGEPFLVDAAGFAGLPGPVSVREKEMDRPIDIRPGERGRILQFPGSADLLIQRAGRGYRLTRYAYMEVFGAPLETREFAELAELNAALQTYSPAAARPLSFARLKRLGLILPYADARRESFLYRDSCGGPPARHVIYSCRRGLGWEDDAESREPAARRRFARTGRGLSCGAR